MNYTIEPMSYKLQCKQNELLTKLKVIRAVLVGKKKKIEVSKIYGMSRNTVGKLIYLFKSKISQSNQYKLLYDKVLDLFFLEDVMKSLVNKSRAPCSNKRSATQEEENVILKLFNEQKLSVGYKSMYKRIQRKLSIINTQKDTEKEEIMCLQNITFSKVRGIYKRNGLKIRKTRSKNGEVKPLYDYKSLGCFEYMHYDVKEILDQHALPERIYKQFKLNKDLPIYEWNIIEVKSRFRFIAYSHNKYSDFGLHFLLFTLQFIRKTLFLHNTKITIGTDNGTEFFSGSTKKKKQWNKLLKQLNTEIYSYNPYFDVRKNLIERSHKTDDEELFIPRGQYMNTKRKFLKETEGYFEYFNAKRPHSGIEMHFKTPLEKLQECKVVNAHSLMKFPTMILEDCIHDIKITTSPIFIASAIEHELKQNTLLDPKIIRNIQNTYPASKKSKNAQYVLTHYLLFF